MHILNLTLPLTKSVYFQNTREVHSREQSWTVIVPAATNTHHQQHHHAPQVITYPGLRSTSYNLPRTPLPAVVAHRHTEGTSS